MQFVNGTSTGIDVGRPIPPPLWFVTNGERTVGPVTTNLLLRGVAAERVPDDCFVRERAWPAFRPLGRIREIAALRRQQERYGIVRIEPTRWKPLSNPRAARVDRLERTLGKAGDVGEMLLFGLNEAMQVTGARVGAVYRLRAPYVGLVASAIAGPGMASRLGHVLPEGDPVVAASRLARAFSERPARGRPSAVVCERLGPLFAGGGVATLPLSCRGRVYALFELGRPDHEFRRTDLQGLADIGDVLTNRISVVRNAS
jgi:hypothetical protein